MADEQIIYISPDEELTNVRERLEGAAARRIILVIPPQTQLRSHVGWRLLHSRARELSKDVVVNSSDRQIRAVAKAAGFRVADSLESSATNKSRPPSRPGRGIGGGKIASRLHGPIGRGIPDNRANSQRASFPRGYIPSNDRSMTQLSPRQPQPPQTHQEADNPISQADEVSSEAGSSTFGGRDKPYSQGEYHIDTAPSIHPFSPPYEDEEPDLLMEDFTQAQNIRQAAQVGEEDAARTEPEHPAMSSPYGKTSVPRDLEDPFAYGEEIQPVSLPEQHGSIPMDELDTDVPDIGDVPTSVIVDGEIEDLGDEGDIVDPYTASRRSWAEPIMEEPAIAEPPRVYGMRPRNSRTGNVPRSPYQDIEEEDTLLPPDQPVRAAPPAPAASMPVSTMANRPPQPILTPQSRNAMGSPTARPIAKQAPASGRTRTVPRPAAKRPPAQRRNSRGIAVVLTSIVLILLILGILLILIPSADITITLPSQSFSATSPVKLTANATTRQDVKLHTVPTHELIFPGKVGPLTGTTQVGGEAKGYVAFTNNGSKPLDIPINTMLATSQGVQFLTLGEAVVPQKSTLPAVPIAAQNAGTIGNVAAKTITVIPAGSINAIAMANNIAPSSVSLTVTNPSPTDGGKAGSTGNGTTNAINALKQMLHQQMQNQFQTWLKGQLHAQDQASKPTPDLSGSSNLLPGENFTIGPVGSDGSFMGTDTLRVTLLVVRTADLQAAARAELNAQLAASKKYHGYALIPQSPIVLSKIKNTPSSDGKSLSISFTPQGMIGQQLSSDQLDTLRSLLAGRKATGVKDFLASSASGLKSVVNSKVTLFPGFFSNIPFWTARINLHVQYHCTGNNCSTG